jgi:MoaA/NifB/PqqE/SkfB family radical SAM enzyme
VYNEPIADTSLIACPHCDLLQRLPELAPGASARCPHCDKELWRHREDSLNRTLALDLDRFGQADVAASGGERGERSLDEARRRVRTVA